jgi:pheromone shutdown-related protein TraB
MTDDNNSNIHRLAVDGKEIALIGTAHVSHESVEQVRSVIEAETPDTVCVELCPSRYEALRQKDRWQNTDIVKVVKEKKAFLLLSNLILMSFQRRIAQKLDIEPGKEMLQAIDSAEAIGARIHLADRDIRVTLSRTWRSMNLWDKCKVLFQLLLSFGETEDLSEADIEQMKQQDALESVLAEVAQALPMVKKILIDERDLYLAQKIKSAPGEKIVAVVGAGHVPGIIANWDREIDTDALEQLPPKRAWGSIVKWGIPLAILVMICLGFYYGGAATGTDMLAWWVLANGVLAGLGALAALAHPLTILASIVAAPLTSLNPAIAAGWVSGLVEAFSRKPQVKDLEALPEDILSMKGFWKNKVTRILLVVVFTNLGSAIGTFVAIPLMLKMLPA